MDLKALQDKGEQWFKSLDSRLAGVPGVIRRAGETFGLAYAPEAAGGIAYYALFSLFPLLLLLVSIASLWLSSSEAIDNIIEFIGEILKIPVDQLDTALENLVSTSGITGLIGLIGVVWAATGVFTSLARNIGRAWPNANQVSVIQGRLMAIIMVVVIALSQFLWVIVTTIVNLLSQIELPLQADLDYIRSRLSGLTLNAISFSLLFFAFAGLYRWVPKTKVRWREAFLGAAFSTLATLVASRVYLWYLNSGLASDRAIYGSLGTTLGVIVFFYINAWIVLFGAHLSSAVAYRYRTQQYIQQNGSALSESTQPATDGTGSLPN
jgi:YihY family inner membrane protein